MVEDIEVNREILGMILAETGIGMDMAENGEAAVSKFSEQPAAYDIIFMDIHMPVMDGYTATRAIRALPGPEAAAVPIVAMTANAFKEDIDKCLQAGMNSHLAKPLEVDKLYAVLAEYLTAPDDKR